MRRFTLTVATVLCLVSVKAFAQGGNASVSGFVQDPTQAVIPGAAVTATNVQTGVVATAITNESGAYNFPSLLPGTYRLSAELSGFRPYVYNDVQLGGGVSARYNFVLEVGAVTQAVEVTAQTTTALAESSASIGQVLNQQSVRDLPLVTNNVLDLMRTMAGVRGEGLGPGTTFAGISTNYVNTTRDGISVQENRYTLGVTSTTLINPDLVGEMRVILTPVDAETGRGNGQVQIFTRSGTNQFAGTAVWTVRNSALDANTWDNNNDEVNGVWTPTRPDWINRHQATVSYGGPIVRNKSFFFALYDHQIERRREVERPTVLTECARMGIFRYWERWANGNALQATNRSGANPITAVVDSFGNPVRPATNPDGSTYTGQLRYFSVFGRVVNTPQQPDCSDAIVEGPSWNSLRTGTDPGGLAQRFLDVMPKPNRFDGGDGLNTAVHQWERSSRNTGSLNLASGSETDTARKQINVKFDHHFNTSHKAAVNYSYDFIDGDYLLNTWPGGYSSQLIRRPQVLTVNFTSTLTPTLLNEARLGYRQNWHVIWAPWEVTDPEKRKVPESFLLQGGGFPIAVQMATVGGMNTNNFSCFTNCAQQGNKTPLYQYGDTMSWTKGKHAFKWGGELRFGSSRGSETPTAPIPKAFGGAGLNPNQAFQSNPELPLLVSNNQTLANSLLYFLSGSMNSAQQYYFIQSADHKGQWLDYLDVENHRKITDSRQREFSLFFKDDWKVTPSLTLNLGMRYDYFGVPFEGQGLTAVPQGGGMALFGVSGRSFDNWMRPDAGVDLNLVTTMEFVGPKTPNPDKSAHPKDVNNFGPAIGFAWQPPWFGGRTNVRGGYQITYTGGGRYVNLANYIFNNQGYVFLAQAQEPLGGGLFDTSDVPSLIPIPPTTPPMQPIPVHKRDVDAWAYDNNYRTPYVQNFTLSVTRDITRNVTLDVRYIGTRGVKLYSDLFNLNAPNVFYNPVLFDALERTRRGEDVPLFDQMFLGLSLAAGRPAVNGTTQRGSEHVRRSTTFQNNLANGDFAAVADSLNIFNGTGSSIVPGAAGEQGRVLRRAHRGFNVPGGTTTPDGMVVPAGLFPENWIVSNPQFDDAMLFSNNGSSNYHSLQVQGALRPTYGLTFQGTYLWSKTLAVPTTGYTNPADRQRDYALAAQHVTHDFRGYGTFALPIGPGKLLFSNASGWIARAIEGWETSFIVNLSTGQPASITAGNMLYAGGVADLVKPLNLRSGDVQWGVLTGSGQRGGSYFGDAFVKVDDPQCAEVAASLQDLCTLQAVADARTGEIVLQNPRPGNRGNVGRQTVELPGSWQFDASMRKTIRISESKSAQIRFDATNILNHPSPGTPSLNINSDNSFGFISSKGNQRREFRGQVRLSF